MEIPVNVVVLTDVNSHSSLLVTILKPNFQSKEEVKAVKKSSLSKKETQTVLHLPVSLQIFLYKRHMPFWYLAYAILIWGITYAAYANNIRHVSWRYTAYANLIYGRFHFPIWHKPYWFEAIWQFVKRYMPFLLTAYTILINGIWNLDIWHMQPTQNWNIFQLEQHHSTSWSS